MNKKTMVIAMLVVNQLQAFAFNPGEGKNV